MDFGVCVATKIDEMGLIGHIENLGYSHAWFTDTQMMWSDCYAALAPSANKRAKYCFNWVTALS